VFPPPSGTAAAGERGREPYLHAPALSWTTTIVGLRRDVLDARHLKTRGLQRADRRLTARARPLDKHLHLLQSMLDALPGGRIGSHLRGERSRLARTLEARASGRLPRDHIALTIGERNDCVVKRSLDVRLPDGDVLAHAAPAALRSARSGTHFLAAFFLPATCIRLGPLRVRALVLVFCPRTGRPRRWRRPREQPISCRRLMSWEG